MAAWAIYIMIIHINDNQADVYLHQPIDDTRVAMRLHQLAAAQTSNVPDVVLSQADLLNIAT
jgi:hypothetical protein